MTARRPALIFDFGNVVAFFDYTRACEIARPAARAHRARRSSGTSGSAG